MINVTLSMFEKHYSLIKNTVIMKFRKLEDAKLKQELLNKASEDWNDAHELFKF